MGQNPIDVQFKEIEKIEERFLSFYIAVIENCMVDKTSLINMALRGKLCGINFGTDIFKEYYLEAKINKKSLNFKIWELNGATVNRDKLPEVLKFCDLGIIVYDIENQKSLEDINYWLQQLKEKEVKYAIIVKNKINLHEEKKLVSGNEVQNEKLDLLGEKKQFSEDEILAKLNLPGIRIKNITCSLKDSTKAKEIFKEAIRIVYENYGEKGCCSCCCCNCCRCCY